MTTFQLNGEFTSVSVTTTPALLNVPNGSNGIIVCNPDTTNSIFIHLSPIGVAAPSAAVNLRGIRVYPGTSVSISVLNEAESSAFPYSMLESTGNNQGHVLAFRSSRGTYSARTACLSNDILGQLDFGGFTGAGTTLNGKGVIRCVASENWSTTATGTRLEFFTTANTTLTNTVRLTIQDGGKCVFNSNAINVVTAQTPATSAAAGTAGDIAWDDTYLYVRMSTGWRRIALGAAF